MAPERKLSGQYSVPTILVVHVLSAPLADALSDHGYFVLKAQNQSEAIAIARMHSRPIQLLVTDNSALGPLVQKYRPKLDVVFLQDKYAESGVPNILEQVRQILPKV